MNMLDNKVALVTGGSRGIGAAIVRHLAAEGADVAFTYLSDEQQANKMVATIESYGRKGLAIQADSSEPKDIRGSVEQTYRVLGRLDILVNNAGIGIMQPFEAMTMEDIDQTLTINTRAAYLGTQAAAQLMPEGGRVITIGSCLAERAPTFGSSLYSMSKAALVGMTKGFAYELAARGITINIVHPGPTDTEMNPADGEFAETQRGHTALGRYGETDDIAQSVVFLAGPGARQITGTSLSVDGGWSS